MTNVRQNSFHHDGMLGPEHMSGDVLCVCSDLEGSGSLY